MHHQLASSGHAVLCTQGFECQPDNQEHLPEGSQYDQYVQGSTINHKLLLSLLYTPGLCLNISLWCVLTYMFPGLSLQEIRFWSSSYALVLSGNVVHSTIWHHDLHRLYTPSECCEVMLCDFLPCLDLVASTLFVHRHKTQLKVE